MLTLADTASRVLVWARICWTEKQLRNPMIENMLFEETAAFSCASTQHPIFWILINFFSLVAKVILAIVSSFLSRSLTTEGN